MQFYASPEQMMRDRSEFARKNIARGRNVVVLSYSGGVLFVAENLSPTLHKVSEIYDRIGFAAVGRYNEFENLRAAGVRLADMRGYSYDRRDVSGRVLATAYAQTLGAIFTEQTKPYEVEICVAQVGSTAATDELYRLTYDGSAQEETGVLAMGGQAETIGNQVKDGHTADLQLGPALRLAVEALASVGGEGGNPRVLTANQLEVAILDRHKPGRTFRRITGNALTALLTEPSGETPAEEPSIEEPPTEAAPAETAPGDEAPEATQPADATQTRPAPADEAPGAESAGEGEGEKKPPTAGSADAASGGPAT
jgi:proteasome alpha subunit